MKRQSTGLLLTPASPASKPTQSALNSAGGTPEAPIVFKTPMTGFFRLSNEVSAPSTEEKEAIADMFQDYIIKNSVKVPVVRLDGARYLFGTKLVIASIINGQLSVRVGGGYMDMSEFVKVNQQNEILKVRTICANQKKKVSKVMSELAAKHRAKNQFQ